MWKMGACIALSAAMTLTSVGSMLPSDWGIETVYADETKTTNKTFTADQLEVIWGNAEHKLEDGQWKLSFANQYDQVKWKVPEAIALADVKSVTFHGNSPLSFLILHYLHRKLNRFEKFYHILINCSEKYAFRKRKDKVKYK